LKSLVVTLFTPAAVLPIGTLSPPALCLCPVEHLKMLLMWLLAVAVAAVADSQYALLARAVDQALFGGLLPAMK
jgi:hypothetical protein